MAQSQIGLQSLFGLVEVDTLSAPVLHLGSQLIPLLAQFLQSCLSSEQLEKYAIKWSHTISSTISQCFTTPTLKKNSNEL